MLFQTLRIGAGESYGVHFQNHGTATDLPAGFNFALQRIIRVYRKLLWARGLRNCYGVVEKKKELVPA